MRAQKSRPLVDRIRKALMAIQASGRHFPQRLLGPIIDHALGLWSGLETFLMDERIEIDNSQVENAIRPTAIGKKNWHCVGAK
ncbi:MAG: transposase [Verrucomicrobiales bacterium]|nr:transposase [Verrucomicrobiales bacterium]